MKNIFTFLLSVFFFVSCAQTPPMKTNPPPEKPAYPKTLEEAVANPHRSPEFVARDKYRHPLDTLHFFGIAPDQTVVEIWPSGGWYTQILAPFLAEKGKYIAAVRPNENSGESQSFNKQFDEWMAKNPEVESHILFTHFDPPKIDEIAPPGTVDVVLTFRNFHNWMSKNATQQALKSFYLALKPDGILGIVEHRGNSKRRQDPLAKNGYVREDYLIKLVESAGFKLISKSEVNANPKDTRDHPEGVWTLPPVLRLGEKDKDKYLTIGESDRMTLKFRKLKPKKTR